MSYTVSSGIDICCVIDRLIYGYPLKSSDELQIDLDFILDSIGYHKKSSTLINILSRKQQHTEWKSRLQNLDKGIEQRSDAWYSARYNMITASDIAQALGHGKFGSQKDFFKKKCSPTPKPFDATAPALKWGIMFEPVAQDIYSKLNKNIDIYEYGLIKHPSIPFIGASPDGITCQGVMLEIKCPWKRKIQEGIVPLQYYYQIQAQLDVCNLDECDYFECEFDETCFNINQIDFINESLYDGYIIEQNSNYTYFDTIQNMQQSNKGTLSECHIIHAWSLRKSSTSRIKRDMHFIDEMMLECKRVWEKVNVYRDNITLYNKDIENSREAPKKDFNDYAFLD